MGHPCIASSPQGELAIILTTDWLQEETETKRASESQRGREKVMTAERQEK